MALRSCLGSLMASIPDL
ncbi:hypothetical protein N7500_005512 [Penicillium coprophilum]|nr:hypothetical protein N7500_005512 [Penicillium coprophilum]